jgi:rod shape determining protein RodA
MDQALTTRRWPIGIPLCAAALIALGLGGIARGDELAGSGDYFSRQLVWLVLATGAWAASLTFHYRRLRNLSWEFFTVALILLLVVYAFPARNGSRRWISLGGFQLQPSELMKLAYVIAMGSYLMFRDNYRTLQGLIAPFVMTIVPVVLILKEPNLGTAMLFFPVLFAMLFTAGAKWRHLAAIGLMGLACTPLLWRVMSSEQRSRVTALFTQVDGGKPPTGDAYHLHQSKQMLALGGTWGSDVAGMPVADPLAYALPEARTDFVFCLVGERWGVPGTVAVLSLYLLLLFQGLRVAARTEEPFGRLVAVGIVTLLATQAAINMAMTVGLMPITGITLPLLSHGGSSLVTTGLALGLLTNIGMRPEKEVSGEPFRFSPQG